MKGFFSCVLVHEILAKMLFDLDGFFLPKYCRKEYILNPEEYDKKRDYLLNLYFGQPDNEEPLAKLGYTTYFCAKFGKKISKTKHFD